MYLGSVDDLPAVCAVCRGEQQQSGADYIWQEVTKRSLLSHAHLIGTAFCPVFLVLAYAVTL